MNKCTALVSAFLSCVAVSNFAFAKSADDDKTATTHRNPASGTQQLSGASADEFIEKHFPNAEIPGPVEGAFNFASGTRMTGKAKCSVPAMGEHSDGIESTCDIVEGGKAIHLTGSVAEEFIDRHFPNADIPGSVEGKFHYMTSGRKKGHAKCFVPAMGERSDGIESSCTLTFD